MVPSHESPLDSASPGTTRLRPSRSLMFCAAVLCGLGLSASFITLVRAADGMGFFEILGFAPAQRVAAAVRLPAQREQRRAVARQPSGIVRASHRIARHPAPSRPNGNIRRARLPGPPGFATVAPAPALGGTRTACVRTCDGFAFPLGALRRPGDLPAHRAACTAACPGAETRLFTLSAGSSLGDMREARAVDDGTPYRRTQTASLFRRDVVPNCSCSGPGNVATRWPILRDQTLRPGDVVVGEGGEPVAFSGSGAIPHSRRDFADYRDSPAVDPAARAAIDKAVGTTYRRDIARAYARRERVREATLAPPANGFREITGSLGGFREIAAPAGSGAGIRVYQASTTAALPGGSAARIITIR